MSVSSARGKRADPLVKKIPENPKYKHVRRTLDTGSSITRYMEKMEELKRGHLFVTSRYISIIPFSKYVAFLKS